MIHLVILVSYLAVSNVTITNGRLLSSLPLSLGPGSGPDSQVTPVELEEQSNVPPIGLLFHKSSLPLCLCVSITRFVSPAVA